MQHPLRRLVAPACASVLLVPLMAGDVGAIANEPGSGRPVAADTGTGTAGSVQGHADPGGDDADGLRVRSQELELDDDLLTVELPHEPEMVILDDLALGTDVRVRSRNQGAWSDWVDLHVTDEEAPDGVPGGEGWGDDSAGIGPVWLGRGADQIQIERHHDAAAAVADPDHGTSHGTDDGVHDGDDGEPFRLESLEVLDTPSVAEQRPRGIRAAATSAAAGASFIRSRSAWATAGMGWADDNGGCGSSPLATADIKAMVVHHTAGTNGYSQADVPAVIRGIWRYHVQSRGWCDVAYNFFVDRFGGVWEGRQGGIDRPIVGGHTFGHNSQTTGVAQLGDFDKVGSPSAMTASTAKLIGWKLGIHGVDPTGRTSLTNRASSSTPKGVAPGASIEVPTVPGHRDLGSTACPGGNTYSKLSSIRSDARVGAHAAVLHDTFLGTEPSQSQYDAWRTYAFRNGLDDTARQMSRSTEYAGPMVDDLYERVLQRESEASGRAYWIRRIQGGEGLRDISIGFYASAERYIKSGNTAESYVRGLYRDILHREADEGGLADWTGRLRRGASLTHVAGGFFGSPESRADRVNRLYRSILDREVDASGRRTWSQYLLRNDDLDLAAHLTGSLEYYQKNLG